MERRILTFTANEQILIKTSGIEYYASNIVEYIEAHFELGDNWSGYDSVRAVWYNDYATISTVLDSNGICRVPYEVLTRTGIVKVNLVGSIADGDTLTDRLTTYPIHAVRVDKAARVTGDNASPVTPSEYEQFVAAVRADADRAEAGATSAETSAESASASAQSASTSASDAQTYAQNAEISATSAESAKDEAIDAKEDAESARDEIRSMRAEATTLSAGSDATASYSNGLLSLGIPRGDKGEKGDKGDTGATPNLSIGTVETLPPTGQSQVTITGTAENPVLNFKLVKGDTGEVTQAEFDEAISDVKADFNRDFEIINKGKNPILYSTIRNQYVKSADGVFAPYSGWSRSDYMEVVGGETLSYYTPTTSSYNVFYDNNKTFISNKMMSAGTHSDGSYRTFDVPTNAKYFAISNSNSAYDATLILRDNVLIDDNNVSLSTVYSSQKIETLMEDAPQILLPKECWAVVGTEFNIYYENVLTCKDINEYYIYPFITPYTSITYNTYSDRLQIMPTGTMVGDYTLRLNIRSKLDWTKTIAYKETTLHIISSSTLSNKRVIFIGDSLTNAGYYPYEIQEVLSAGGVQSLGTQTSTPWIDGIQRTVHHEGRGGWSAYNYVEEASMSGITNAFWNPNTSAFDFSYYMTQQGYSRPDIVFLNLGTNGASHTADNISAITEMITSIHAYDNTIPICVSLITPPATQDGWTYSAPGGSAGQFALAQMGLNSAYIENYDDVLSNVYVSPAYFNLDRYHDYPTAEFPVSARNPEIVTRQINNVHPSKYGHLKLADVYWAMIQMLLS